MTSTILLDTSEAPNANKLKDHSTSETLKSAVYTPSDSTIYVHPAILPLLLNMPHLWEYHPIFYTIMSLPKIEKFQSG